MAKRKAGIFGQEKGHVSIKNLFALLGNWLNSIEKFNSELMPKQY